MQICDLVNSHLMIASGRPRLVSSQSNLFKNNKLAKLIPDMGMKKAISSLG
jgi:hypothetical protein